MVYVTIVIWMLVLGFLTHKSMFHFSDSVQKSVFTFGVLSLCAVVMGLRNVTVGVDTSSYKEIFDLVSDTSTTKLLQGYYFQSIEIGYILLMKISSIWMDNYYFFQIIVAVLFCFGMRQFMIDHCDYPMISMSVFVGIGIYLLAFNISRQMMAVMFLANGWKYIVTNQKWKAFGLFLLAILFHYTSIVFGAALMIYWFRNNKWFQRVIPVGIILVAVNYQFFINKLSFLASHYGNYLKNAKVRQTASGVMVLWGIMVCLGIYVLYMNRKTLAIERVYAIFSIIYVTANIIGLQYNYFERLGCYFMPFTILLFESIAKHIRSRHIKALYKGGVFTCFNLYFLLSALTSTQYHYLIF